MTLKKNKIIHIIFSLAIAFGLAGCEAESGPPSVPVGKAIDVMQSNTSVTFDFKVKETYKYDVALEVFDKTIDESGPLAKTTGAHFKVKITSLDMGTVILEQETKAVNGKLKIRSYVSVSRTEKEEKMSFEAFLIREVPLKAGHYRIFVENINPIATLDERLVKVSILRSWFGK